MTNRDETHQAAAVCKLHTLGHSAAGKTSLMTAFCDESPAGSTMATIGIEFKVKDVDVNGRKVRVLVYDTGGQERFHALGAHYLRNTHGVLLVYDITDRESFERARRELPNVREEVQMIPIVLVGNKIDKERERVVSYEDGQDLSAQQDVRFFETSAVTFENVEQAFTQLIEKALEVEDFRRTVQRKEQDRINLKDASRRSRSCCS